MKRITIIAGAFVLAVIAFVGLMPTAFAQDLTQEGVSVPDRDSALWSALVGAWLPVIIATINRYRWTSQTKGIMTFVVSAVAALGTSYFAGELAGEDYVVNVMIVLSAATVSYQTFWRPTNIAPSIERATG
jgi:hypothetical protein